MRVHDLLFLFLAAALATSGCEESDRPGGDVDAGGGDVDTGTAMPPEVPPEARDALQALTRGVGTSAALAGPLLADGQMLRDSAAADQPGTMRDETTQMRVENGVSGNSIVTDPACTMFDWNLLQLSVMVTFTSCILESTGEPLDGGVLLDVNFGPTEFILTFTSLQVADLGIDGEVGLRLGGACRERDTTCMTCPDGDSTCAMMQTNQQTLWADINFMLGQDINVVLDDVQLDHDASGTTVGGTGTIGSPAFSGSFTGNSAHWNPMECLPSSGTVLYQPAGGQAITVEFTPTTPTTGAVMVQIPPFPPFSYDLFEPCGSGS